jgi:outer membrane lipoprotein-sorting protein
MKVAPGLFIALGMPFWAFGQPEGVPFAGIGAKATAAYRGEANGIEATEEGVRLRAGFQKLAGHLTRSGLAVESTEAAGGRMHLVSTALGRPEEGLRWELPAEGRPDLRTGTVAFVRPGLTEEYAVSVDGIRQDFVVPTRPPGTTDLVVELRLEGAAAEPIPGGARLTLERSGRELAYTRLAVTDATGRSLAARMEVRKADRLEIRVEDRGANFPVRIDPTFSDADWMGIGEGLMSTQGFLDAVAVDASGTIYVGGTFSISTGGAADHVAKWDGSSWSALGTGVNGRVFALAVSGTSLYVGGSFTVAGGGFANNLARWDGAAWSAVGSGTDSAVYALAVSGADLYAGGQFTSAGGVSANRVARWNGTSWSALGTGMDHWVTALSVSGSTLYAGGWFTTAGGTTVNHVARWNGTSWSALGAGTNGIVNDLALSGTTLYAGGEFTTAGGTTAHHVARWNGTSWSALGSGASSPVKALAVSGTTLYAGGDFTTAGGISANHIARWNGTAWGALGSGFDDAPLALAVSGTELVAAGLFSTAGGSPAGNRIASWNGSAWSSLGSVTRLDDMVFALAVSGTDLYVGGRFTRAGFLDLGRIAKWDGTAWSALGSGMDGTVYSLAVAGNDLYAGGSFTTAGGVPANFIARWDGTRWNALGAGMSGSVNAILVSGTTVYAGGRFSAAGGMSAQGIARWNGTAWSGLGTGLGPGGESSSLAMIGTDLYVAGYFSSAGGISASSVAKWNGSSWSALGSGAAGFFPYISALAVLGTDLYAAGSFTTMGGVPANRVARWDGSAWTPLGSGLNDNADALAVSGNDLYAGGRFTSAGGASANRIARWDGSAWTALGPAGLNNPVWALASTGTGLYAGGEFTAAGGKGATYLAHLEFPEPEIVVSGNGSEIPDGDTTPGAADHTDFGTVLAAGGASVTRTFAIRNDGPSELAVGPVSLSGSHATDFQVTLPPAGGVPPGGTTNVEITFDPSGTGTRSATVQFSTNVTGKNPFDFAIRGTGLSSPPTISAIANQTINEDSNTGALAFTVGDAETSPGSLQVSGSSSNQAIVPDGNIVFGGSGANRTVRVTPLPNRNGVTLISVRVSDGTNITTTSFTLTVLPVNDAPMVSDIAHQLIQRNGSTNALPFTAVDSETLLWDLVVTASSDHQALVPDENIVFGGNFSSRTVTVTPQANQTGMATITVTVSDGELSASDTFTVTVNNPPEITGIPAQTIAEDTQSGVLAFTVGDVETAAGALSVVGQSDNQALVPNGNLILGGSGALRTVTVTPLPDQSGLATITLTVSDGSGTTPVSFTVTVLPVNDPPTVTPIPDQTLSRNTASSPLPFTVGDVETTAGALAVTGSSGNQALVPDGNIVFGGSGANRTVTVTPSANQTGSAVITVTVSDGDRETSETFAFRINDPPVLSDLPNQSIDEDSHTGALAFSVGDAETATEALLVSGSSDNPLLVPDGNILFGGSGPDRTVTVTPLPDQNGSATLTVTVSDGVDSVQDTFTLTVHPVNDPPVITSLGGGPSAVVLTDPGATAVTTVTASDPDLPVQPLSFSLAGGADADLFGVDAVTGELAFLAVPNPALPRDADADNDYEVIVQVTDSLSLADTQSLVVHVPPGGLDRQPPVVVITTPSASTRATGAILDLAGTVRDGTGLKALVVTLNGQPLVLDSPPDLPVRTPSATPLSWSVTGTAAENGPNVIVVEAMDLNGRTGRATRTVTYVDPALAALAGRYEALLEPSGTPALDRSGLVIVTVGGTGAFSGAVWAGGTRKPVSGFLARDGSARFKPALRPEVELIVGPRGSTRSLGFLSLRVGDPAGLSGGLSDGSTVVASFAGARAPHGKTNPVPESLLNQPLGQTFVRGTYNVAFPSRAVDGADAPQGEGFCGLHLDRTGTVALRGYLADGTSFTGGARLRADRTVAILSSLYGNQGAVGGELRFDPGLSGSDVSGTDWLWLRPERPGAAIYPLGWPEGVRVDALGTKYAPPGSLDFGQGSANLERGNASLEFSGGQLAGPLRFPISLDPRTGAVAWIPVGSTDYRLRLLTVNGQFSGTFLYPGGTRPLFRGILLNKGVNRAGFGFFLSPGPGGQGGGVTIDPGGY